MKVCLFDIDGTLISSGGAGRAAFYAALEHDFQRPAPHHDVPFSGRTDRAILGDIFARHAIEDTPDNTRRFFQAYLRRLPDMLATRGGAVLPGIASLLSVLAQRDDVAVGLLTGNTRVGAGVKLGFFGLAEHFRFGSYGDEHLRRDAVAADAVTAAHAFLGYSVEPHAIWVIGDTPLDVQCARAIGARAVAVATGLHTLDELAVAEPDLLLGNLADPTSLLKAWDPDGRGV